jgi:hypothetical protein
MPRKRKVVFILEAVVFFILIAVLSSVVVPQKEQLTNDKPDGLRARELNDIREAVTEMLADSPSGTLKPVGPTRDMGQVVTDDIVPLVLTSYLGNDGAFIIESDCYYIFSSDGTVTQDCP